MSSAESQHNGFARSNAAQRRLHALVPGGAHTYARASESRRAVAALLFVVAVAWLIFNGPVEGPTLLTLTPRHGLTLADLPSIPAVIYAGWLALPRARRKSQRTRERHWHPEGHTHADDDA
jgi:hypothetical protein